MVMRNSAAGGSREEDGRECNPDEVIVVDSEPRRSSRHAKKKKRKKAQRKADEMEEIAKKEEAMYCKADEDAFWRRMEESEGFDLEGGPCYYGGLSYHKGGANCPLEVSLYAKAGLHRYNMLEGTNLHLHEVEKYNVLCIPMPVSYHITLIAEDPATSSFVVFQTQIEQRDLGQIDFTCYISKPKGIKSEIYPSQFFDAKDLPQKWPSEEAFADKSRFLYKVQKSDWEEHDWIHLYMEFAFFNRNRTRNHNMSDLKILNVLLETEENLPYETVLKSFKNVLVYIRYDQDLGADGVCKYMDIVRRTVEPTTQCLSLFGEPLLLVPDSD
ncbi:hypothetical protein N665_0115s0061 [Sinapis alba]|nr:hypothetical protein N665_0115s0061 [Sinapis alba]